MKRVGARETGRSPIRRSDTERGAPKKWRRNMSSESSADMALQRGAATSFNVLRCRLLESRTPTSACFFADRIGRALAHATQRSPVWIVTAPQKREAAASNALGNHIL
jgi:hypothetical protein